MQEMPPLAKLISVDPDAKVNVPHRLRPLLRLLAPPLGIMFMLCSIDFLVTSLISCLTMHFLQFLSRLIIGYDVGYSGDSQIAEY